MDGNGSPLNEELSLKHKKEIKELKAKVQSLKKAVPKGDKKRKKKVDAEVLALEQELQSRHAAEMLELQLRSVPASTVEQVGETEKEKEGGESAVTDALERLKVEESGGGEGGGTVKKSRAQKRKAKKAQLERERAERIAQEEAEVEATGGTPREQERERLNSILKPLGLAIKDITPDGHCLYAAVSDQLSVKMKLKVSVTELRSQCCDYVRAHGSEFLPYLTHPDTGDQFTQEQFEEYCQEIAETAAWGGQLEILAFSHIFKVPISVYQANVPVMCIGEEYATSSPLHLSYHHHEFGLGEHYNSVIPSELAQNSNESALASYQPVT